MTACRSTVSFAGAGVQCDRGEHPGDDHTATVRGSYSAMDTWMPGRGETPVTLTWTAPIVGATLEERFAEVRAARETEGAPRD